MAVAGDLERALQIAERRREKADEKYTALIEEMQQMDADIARLKAALENTDPELDRIVTDYVNTGDPAA